MGGNTLRVFMAALCLAVTACTVSQDAELDEPGENYAGGPADFEDGPDDGDGDGDDGGDGDGGGIGSDDGGDGSGSGTAVEPVDPVNPSMGSMLETGCSPYNSGVYTPFPNYGPVSTGTIATFPWRGPMTYPDGIEDFRAYGTTTVECGSNKSARDHLDVTAGCLHATANKTGQIQLTPAGYYRSFALPYDAVNGRRVAWGDQGVEYRFFYSEWTGLSGNPGFKAFVRYLTEYDLYVASWRRDGVVQIQKKHCGQYTTLKRIAGFGAPSLNTWHTIKFEVVGSELRLFLDGQLVMATTDTTLTHGTAGIRIDSANGSQIDDWRAYAP